MLLTLPPGSARLAPTVADLVARAIADTDFLNDLVPNCGLTALACDACDMAIDAWEAANDVPVGATDVPARTINDVRAALIAHGSAALHTAERDAIDARADAIEAGDIDRDGNAIGYAAYRSARA